MVRINLLPVRVSKKKEAGKQQLLLFLVVLVLGVVLNGIFHQNRAAALADVQKRVAKTKADIATLDKIIGQVKEITAQQEQLKKKLDTLDKLKQGRSGPVRMLDELSNVTPRRLWLRKLEEKAGMMNIQGSAISIDDVSQFIGALKTSRYFGNVELKKTEAKSETRGDPKSSEKLRYVDFTVTATSKYAPQPEPDAKGGPAKGKG
jgi:type IV pilus assembly protein PilN